MSNKSEHYSMVRQFLTACGSTLPPWFREAKVEDAVLVANLIEEEVREFEQSMFEVDKLDALVDIAYVAYNGLALLGLNIEAPAAQPMTIYNQFGLTRQVLLYVRPLCEERCQRELNQLIDTCANNAKHNGCDFDGAFKVVHAANMSKFWDKVELANITAEHKYTEARGTTKYVVRRASDGKIIKPPSFKAPELSCYLAKP